MLHQSKQCSVASGSPLKTWSNPGVLQQVTPGVSSMLTVSRFEQCLARWMQLQLMHTLLQIQAQLHGAYSPPTYKDMVAWQLVVLPYRLGKVLPLPLLVTSSVCGRLAGSHQYRRYCIVAMFSVYWHHQAPPKADPENDCE